MGTPGRWVAASVLVAAVGLATAPPVRGQDSDQRRYYLSVRYGESNPAVAAHDVGGISVGANLNRYVGVELAMDAYQLNFEPSGLGKVSELAMHTYLPQLRVRYPLFGDRLVPYVIGGVGVTVLDVNDVSDPPVELAGGGSSTTMFSGTVGGGIEYFVADNVAIGIEGKYVFTESQRLTTSAGTSSENLSTGLLTAGVRVFYPELHPPNEGDTPARNGLGFYLVLRESQALLMQMERGVFEGLTVQPEQRFPGTNFTQQYSIALGVDLTSWVGLELSLDPYELKISAPGAGRVAEYAVFPVAVQARLRYPVFEERASVNFLAGVGGEFAEVNDTTEAGSALGLGGDDITVFGVFGAGFEYFIASNLAIGIEAKYAVSRGHQIDFQDRKCAATSMSSASRSVFAPGCCVSERRTLRHRGPRR